MHASPPHGGPLESAGCSEIYPLLRGRPSSGSNVSSVHRDTKPVHAQAALAALLSRLNARCAEEHDLGMADINSMADVISWLISSHVAPLSQSEHWKCRPRHLSGGR
jgi:hypothetical protein